MELLLGVLGNEGCRYFSQADVDAMSTKPRASPRNDAVAADSDDARWRRTLRTYVRNNFRFYHQMGYIPPLKQHMDSIYGDATLSNVAFVNFRFHRQTIYDIVDHNYRDWDDEEGASSDAASRRRLASLAALITDGQYVAPTVDLAARHSACGRSSPGTFLYTFGETDCAAGRRQARRNSDILAYVFGAPLADGLDPSPRKHRLTLKKLQYLCNNTTDPGPSSVRVRVGVGDRILVRVRVRVRVRVCVRVRDRVRCRVRVRVRVRIGIRIRV